MSGHARTTSASGYLVLFKAVVYRDLTVWLRYPVDAVFSVIAMVIFFAIMFYGGQMVAGQAIEDSIEGLLIGYFLWTFATTAYAGITNDIRSEASWGTLERHFITPYGFGPVVVAKSMAILLRTFLIAVGMLAIMLFLTGTTLQLPVATVVVVGVLTIAGVLGLGLAMGGLSVLYKRIGNLTNLLQFGFIALVSAPAFDLPWTRVLPLVQGSGMLQRAMQNGVRLWEFEPTTIGVLVGTTAIYLGLGYVAFGLLTKRARRLGVLGDY